MEPACLVAVHHGLEESEQIGGGQQLGRMAGRRDGGARHPVVPQRLQQAHGAGPGGDGTVLQTRGEQLVLAGRDGADGARARRVVRRAERQLKTPGAQEGRRPVLPGAAVDILKIVVHRVEGPLSARGRQTRVEGALPGRGMRPGGVGDDPVGVEDHGPHRVQASGQGRRAGHGDGSVRRCLPSMAPRPAAPGAPHALGRVPSCRVVPCAHRNTVRRWQYGPLRRAAGREWGRWSIR